MLALLPSSSSRQKALEQVRQRAAHWTISETKAFVELWGDDRVQIALYDNYRNEVQYKRLSDKMRKMGFHRHLEQCRQRAKDLRRGFKEIKDGNLHSNRARQTMPFFSLLDRFLMMSRGLVIPKVCVNRAKQKGRKSRGRRQEAQGERPFMLMLPSEGPDSHPLHFPDHDAYVHTLELPDYQLQRRGEVSLGQDVGLPDYELPGQDPSAHGMGAASYQLVRQGETPRSHARALPDFPLQLQDSEASLGMSSCRVSSHSPHRDMVLSHINGLSDAGGLWPEISSATAAERPSSAASHEGKHDFCWSLRGQGRVVWYHSGITPDARPSLARAQNSLASLPALKPLNWWP